TVLLNIGTILCRCVVDCQRATTVPCGKAVYPITDTTAAGDRAEVTGERRPATGEGHAQNIQFGITVIVQVVVVGRNVLTTILLEHAHVARSFVLAALIADHRTLAGVRPVDTGGTGDGHVVTAIGTLAAAAEIHKLVFEVDVSDDIRCFHTMAVATVDVGHAAGQLTGA